LPTWRRTKPRRIWEDDSCFVEQRAEQDFCQGLTAADNASVIKGTHAQAWIPPLHILPEVPTPRCRNFSRAASEFRRGCRRRDEFWLFCHRPRPSR
jgi:hypothetical protein